MIHNALQRFTELQRGAKVALGLDAGAGGLERMSETLQLVKDFWAYPEDAYLRGARICQGATRIAAGGAGNYSAAAFAIQTDGWIATLRGAIVSLPSGSGLIGIKRGLPLPTASTDKRFVDMRVTGSPIGNVTYVNNVAAVPGGTHVGYLYSTQYNPQFIDLNWVCVNQGVVATEIACVIYAGTANVELDVTFFWTERQMLPGELAR